MLLLFESFAWRMVAAGLPLDRASVHVGTLHPQLIGFAWNWLINDGFCDEVKVATAAHTSDAYRKSALFRVQEFGETIRRKTRDPEAQAEFSLLKELAERGLTEYIAMPMSGAGVYHNTLTIATKRDAGFSDTDFATIRRCSICSRCMWSGTSRCGSPTMRSTPISARRLPRRCCRARSSAAPASAMRAIIWVSDLRGFTDLSGRLGDANMIALLNAYFDCLAGAVLRHGGEVLKFMGDGLLAVFPIERRGRAKPAAASAVAAAQDALAGLDRLNTRRAAAADSFGGWNPLRTGIALHEGDVFFGNIGAPERLDFTVIGSAVNEASRVEALQKTLGRSLLITGAAARHLDIKLDDLGEHSLRGVEGKLRIFSPASS